MFDYDELEGIVGCYCTLIYPYRGHSEGTVVADYGKEVVVRLTNGKELTECRDEVLIYEQHEKQPKRNLLNTIWAGSSFRQHFLLYFEASDLSCLPPFVEWSVSDIHTMHPSALFHIEPLFYS